MIVFGRKVLETTLDPLPRNFRAAPGVIAMTRAEIEAFKDSNGQTFKLIAAICFAEDNAEALLASRKLPKRRNKLGPSTRLAMLRTLNPARPAALKP